METLPEPTREKRNSVIVRAIVMTADGRSRERRVRNLSRHGACIEHDNDLSTGATVMLHMGSMPDLVATVRWVSDRLAGLSFNELIDLDEARKPRGVGVTPRAGWIADLNNPYR
ncbi:PilZ domain-containing protein [Sphingomonas sp. S6]|jgi:hypothetical protein|uniref:PilZ domain-containing protein n=1 Tax=Sphingomonas sp. S6 TaxID=3368600 RepID=UPI000FB5E472|nr:PilZ domain-containing protein [uncultured Sphingomonas sp.]RTL15732.1 MAG: PilZ domain-containing protein [Sphingomonadaceae bacterium]